MTREKLILLMSERISVPSISTASGMSETASPMATAEGGLIQGFADRFNEADHHLVVLGMCRGRVAEALETGRYGPG